VSGFFCNLIIPKELSIAQLTITFLAFLGSIFSFAAQQQPLYIAENTIVVNANQIHVAAPNQPQNTATQTTQNIFVVENTIVTGWSHIKVPIQNTSTRKQHQLANAKPKDPVVTKKVTHPHLFTKKPLQNKYTYQSIEAVATIVPNASKNPLKNIFLKNNDTTQALKIHQENSVATFYETTSNEQNNKTYTLLCYFPPPSPSLPTPDSSYVCKVINS